MFSHPKPHHQLGQPCTRWEILLYEAAIKNKKIKNQIRY
jgi:hypothetical protein